VVVQAHLAAQATKGKESQQRRRKQKFALMTMMYEKGYSRQEVIDLFRFIEWVMILPLELEKAFKNDLATYEEEKNMPYISNLEKESLAVGEARGLAVGEAKGRAAGKTELVIQLLNRRTGKVSKEILAKIEALPIDRLEKLGEDLLDFTGNKDLADWLQQYGE
jgi:predicted transposase YdaD